MAQFSLHELRERINMTERRAACSCGQLSIVCSGEPVRISICHCLACQRRTGSVFSTQARYRCSDVVAINGSSNSYIRTADSGNQLTFRFCPNCGSTVYFQSERQPDLIAIPVGAFADSHFPAPRVSVYESRMHEWVVPPQGEHVEHLD
jgi:hypothetical protein